MSQAEKTGMVALLLAALLALIHVSLALVPLLCFVLISFAAPFFPRWSYYLPIISRGHTNEQVVALTFDDGPSPASTPFILDLLKRFNFKATFFVVGKKAAQYPELITAIAAGGHAIGNHSWSHDNLLMLRSTKQLSEDIQKTQNILQAAGVRPTLFRPPAGISNPRLKTVLRSEKLQIVNFSCRAFDRGNKSVDGLAERILTCVRPGAILLLHDICPAITRDATCWKEELQLLFSSLQREGYDIAELEKFTVV